MVLHRNHNFMRPRLIKDIKGENIVFFFSKNSTLGRWVWWIIALAFIVADLAPKHCKLGCSSKQEIIADCFKFLPKVNLFLHAFAKIKICHRFINFLFIKISCKWKWNKHIENSFLCKLKSWLIFILIYLFEDSLRCQRVSKYPWIVWQTSAGNNYPFKVQTLSNGGATEPLTLSMRKKWKWKYPAKN